MRLRWVGFVLLAVGCIDFEGAYRGPQDTDGGDTVTFILTTQEVPSAINDKDIEIPCCSI